MFKKGKRYFFILCFLFCLISIFPTVTLADDYDDYNGRISFDSNVLAYIDNNNDLYMTGVNRGAFLNNQEPYITKPIKVMEDVIKVSLSDNSVAVIKEDGSLWTWGKNRFGNCANGVNPEGKDTAILTQPYKVMDDVIDVQLSMTSGGALKGDHSLWLWGDNEEEGYFGNGSSESSYTPIHVKDNVKSFSIGPSCCGYVNYLNELYIAGENLGGQLGIGSNDNYLVQREFKKVLDNVKQVSVGNNMIAAVLNNGELDIWGENIKGSLGLGSNDEKDQKNLPTKLMDDISCVSIETSCGGAVSKTGDFYTWGSLYSKDLDFSKPQKINNGFTAVYTCIDNLTRIAVDENGHIWFYGDGYGGSSGDDNLNAYYETATDIGYSVSPQPKVSPSSIRFSSEEYRLETGQKESLIVIPTPSNADLTGIRWESSSSSIIDVTNGLITAKKAGEATVTATTNNGKQASTKVIVTDPIIIGATKVKLKTEHLTLKTGQSYHMNLEIEPADASLQSLNWNSSDNNIAKVENGVITANKKGTTTIEVSSTSGAKAKCTVLVRDTATTPTIIPDSVSTTNPTSSYNLNRQHYLYNSYVVSSYLVKGEKGYMRVEDLSSSYRNKANNIVVSYFNDDYQCINEKTLNYELPIFGGFYNGDNFYYLVFGQNNYSESDNTEVVRIVKYDKNWNRLNSLSLYGMNTQSPFAGGSVRFAQSGDNLYIRTCHRMYKSEIDKRNHQSNMTIQLNIPDMTLIQSYYIVANISFGYISHSFNQFIIVDGNRLVALDHGDAYDRGVILTSYTKGVSADGFVDYNYYTAYSNIKEFNGNIGDNNTGASIGGLEASSNNYLTVGNSIERSLFPNGKTRNIYLTVTPKSQLNLGQKPITKEIQISNLSEGDLTTSTPHLVKYTDNRFLIIWSTMKNSLGETGVPDGTVSFVFVDGDGNLLGSVQTVKGFISNCKPIVSGNVAQWYVTDGNTNTLYSLSSDGKLTEKSVSTKSSEPVSPVEPEDPDLQDGSNLPIEENPETPGDASIPGNPIKPSNPSNPENPGSSEQPGQTDTPSEPSNPSNKVPVYRLYNNVSMEHLYTTDSNEVTELTKPGSDWKSEGTGWNAPSQGDAVYRLYNPVLHDHLYTKDKNEVNVLTTQDIWVKDFNGQPLFYSGGDKPIFRLYQPNGGMHLLTTDENEYNVIPGLWGWRQEGVALNGLS